VEPAAFGREAHVNEDQYLNWKADIISEYRREAFSPATKPAAGKVFALIVSP